MRRTASFIVFGLGVLFLVAGLIKILPGGIGLGAAWCFWGLLLFGMSFIPRPAVEPGDEPELSAFQRVAGMFYMPGAVFRSFRRHPTWLTPLLIITLVGGIYSFAFTKRVTPERIASQTTKTLDSMVENGWMTADMVQKAKADALKSLSSPVEQAAGVLSGMVGMFVLMAIWAVVALLVILIFGGRINFWQSLAVAFYAALPVVIVNKLLSLLLLYLKDPIEVHPILGQETLVQDNLGVLFTPGLNPVLFVLASVIGVLSLYKLWLSAAGLRAAGEKVSSGGAWAATIILLMIAVLFGVIAVSVFPGALS